MTTPPTKAQFQINESDMRNENPREVLCRIARAFGLSSSRSLYPKFDRGATVVCSSTRSSRYLTAGDPPVSER